MALSLVTIKARTRGKNPQVFTFDGVGKLTERDVLTGKTEKVPVLNDDGSPKLENGSPVFEEVQAPARDEKGNVIRVHDVQAEGLTSNLQDVIDLYGSKGYENPMQQIIDGSLTYFNYLQRKAASPVQEVDKSDELTELVAAMIAAGALTEDSATIWRRSVTTGANAVEMSKAEFALMTKEVKAFGKDKAEALLSQPTA